MKLKKKIGKIFFFQENYKIVMKNYSIKVSSKLRPLEQSFDFALYNFRF